MKPKIIDELENLFPMLKDDEYNGLLDSIRGGGQKHPIEIGKIDDEGEPFIIDGHNRYRICKKLGIDPFFLSEIRVFEDIHEAKLWMINNQRERRNLNNFELAELAVLEREIIAEINKGKQGTRTDLCEDSVKNIAQNSGQCEERDRSENTDRILAKKAGVSHDTIARVSKIMEKCSPDIISSLRAGELTINKAYTTEVKKEIQARNEEIKRNNPIPTANGKYQTIVIDPPWPMEKIALEKDPHDVGFDYPTMSEEELMDFPLQDWADDQCHLYLWTTQRFLFMAKRLMEHWGFNYIFLMTWMKNGGFQPFGLPQYNTEFVLFGKKGALPFIETKKFFTGFQAPRREHSRKPDEFYDLVKRVSPGPRIDIFSREKRDGFEQFGNETEKF